MIVFAALSTLSFALSGSVARVIPDPQPKATLAPSGGFAAVTAPVRGKGGKGHSPKDGMVLRLVHTTPDATVRTLWSARLPYWPGAAVVSDDGRVATVGSWYGLGDHEAVTLFDDAGRVLASHPVERFATPGELASLPKFSINVVPTLIKEARYESVGDAFLNKLNLRPRSREIKRALGEMDDNPSVLAVRLAGGRTVYFDPGDGRLLKL